jgi:hypothetical protein
MVSPTTRAIIWARAAGHCQYPGCNDSLIGDLVSGTEDANFGLVAHIVASTPGGPRGDPVRSPALADDPANLMLLCYRHHKLIDVEGLAEHPEQRLIEMKAAHESRIQIVTAIVTEKSSHVLRYGASIGAHDSPISYRSVAPAMLPERYPAGGSSIGIEILGSAAQDSEQVYWAAEPQNLERQFDAQVRPRIATREISHMSVFGLAPIPLLIRLGTLLGDIVAADVYQRHREPVGWKWAKDGPRAQFKITPAVRPGKVVALKLALSASVSNDRIERVLGADVPIWAIEAENPHNDVMRYPEDLVEFRRAMRRLFVDLKTRHGSDAVIHIFPAVPVSVAIEVGRVWIPKADLPMTVYDESRGAGFVPRLTIGM